jgi:hypothetical protein
VNRYRKFVAVLVTATLAGLSISAGPSADAALLVVARDVTRPHAYMTGPTSEFNANNAVQLAWKATDAGSGVANSDVRFQRTSVFGGPTSKWRTWKSKITAMSGVFTAEAGYQYCFSVRSRDRAGDVSQWSAARCTFLPIDDNKLYSSVGCVRQDKQVGGWLGGTWSSMNGKGSWLQTFTPLTASRVGVVGETGPGLGTVAVFVGSFRVGTIDLSKAAPSLHRLILLPRLSGHRTGILKLVGLNSGGVRIDGVAVAP